MIDRQHLVFTGPSGSGKSTLIKHVLDTFPTFAFSVSHTTRAPRSGEADGKSYFFVSRDRFEEMIADNELLEHTEYNGNYYGTSIAQLQDAKCTLLLDIEYDGILFCRAHCPNFVTVYIHCDKDAARLRLQQRMNSEVESRMQLYDGFCAVRPLCTYAVDNNRSLEDSKAAVEDIVRKAFAE